MAEKNTLSILETIKKKMMKLDQPKEESKISDLGDEFQYIAPAKKVEAKPTEPAAEKSSMPKSENDSSLEDHNKTAQAAPKNPAPATTEKKLDDFNLDDLDLDDETSISKKPVTHEEPKAVENVGEEFSEEDVEDYEDEVDFAEEVQDPSQQNNNSEVAAESPKLENSVDELNLDDLEIEPQAAAEKPATLEEDELDLSALDLENEKAEEIPQKKPEPENHDDDLNLDDLNLDDLNLEEESVETPAPQAQEVAEENKLDDINLDDLENEVAEEVKKESVQDAVKPEVVEENKFDDINLDDLENEVAEEVKKESVQEDAKPEVVEENKLDDINLDDLENEVAEEIKKESVQEAAKPEVAQEKSGDLDDINLDDLEKELEKTATTSEQNINPAQKEEVIKQEIHDDDLDDIDLSDLELSAKEETLLMQQPKIEKEISAHDEIDLEFEKEIMGLKPEFTKESSIAAEALSPKVSQQSIAQVQANQQLKPQLQAFQQPISPSQLPESWPTQSQQSSALASNQKSEAIIHDTTIRQATDSIKRLIDAKNVVAGISAFSQSPAFSELAMQLMEPKLERWLNENLPDMVEKVVREEIKKLIPKE